MKKGKFSYTTCNQLSTYLKRLKVERSFIENKSVRLSDLEEELANFCELTPKSIVDIKRGVNQPSLQVAMRIASYFDVPVEEMFILETKEELLLVNKGENNKK